MAKKKVLVIADAVTPTGFSTVSHGIINNLPRKMYEIHHLGVNYTGDPHDNDWLIYPAGIGGDSLGMNRLKGPKFSQEKWDGIFILNDIWVVNSYLKIIKENFKEIPPIIVYFPVDSMDLSKEWVSNFDIVKKVVVYTDFGFEELSRIYDEDNVAIVPHGINQDIFKKVFPTRNDAKKTIFADDPSFLDGFIVLSASRNQPRKKLDITLKGFAEFAIDKPLNVKLYMHCGLKDFGVDILKLATRYGIDNRLVLTNMNPGIQAIPVDRLNLIYNACDVGINTSIGEGWSLTNMEHAATGAPQIVPNHSALPELFSDCGILVNVNQSTVDKDTLTTGGLVHPRDVASALEKLYSDKELYKELAEKGYNKFSSEKFTWKYIVKNQWQPIFEDVIYA